MSGRESGSLLEGAGEKLYFDSWEDVEAIFAGEALKLIRTAENSLGFALILRSAGGKDGGGSFLTTEGKEWLERYEAYRDACVSSNSRLYTEFFPEQR